MRQVFVGASPIAITAARMLAAAGPDAVIVDDDAGKLDRLGGALDDSTIPDGDTTPAIGDEAAPIVHEDDLARFGEPLETDRR